MSYGKEKHKLTRVLSEMFSHMDCIGDIKYSWKGEFVDPESIKTIYLKKRLKDIGRIPRAYEDDPCDMPIPVFVAWLGEQIARMTSEASITYYIDFRPEANLIAGNGMNFGSCYSLPYYHHCHHTCYNNSPSAYAYSRDTAIMYSLSEDGKSLKNRSFVYFLRGGLYFGRFYGNDISKSVCDKAALLLGFDSSTRHDSPGSVGNICCGQVYMSDDLEVAYGSVPEYVDYDDKIMLRYHCVSCGNEMSEDSSNCLCDECRESRTYCEGCGEAHDESYMLYVEGQGMYCNECAHVCNHCGEAYRTEDMTDIGTSRYIWVCDHCLSERCAYCEDCNTWSDIDYITYIEGEDRQVCEDCLRVNYMYCDLCEQWHEKEDMVKCFDCGEWVCKDCSVICSRCGCNVCNHCKEEQNDMYYCSGCGAELVTCSVDVE